MKKLGKNETKTFEKTSVWNLFLFKFRRSSCCEKVKRTFVKPRCNFNRMNFFTQKKKLLISLFFFKGTMARHNFKENVSEKELFQPNSFAEKKAKKKPKKKRKKVCSSLFFFLLFFLFVCFCKMFSAGLEANPKQKKKEC